MFHTRRAHRVSDHSSRTIPYRAELDGLRSLAILGVLIFHFNPSWLKGGYLGVDVFFVLSGFLITSIIKKKLDERSFSLIGFWKRRYIRLYPALLATVMFTAALGSLIYIGEQRDGLFIQGVAAMFSFENLWLAWNTGGYWDVASESIPFLHMWSLSLEEQFYILFPPLLVGCSLFARPPFRVVVSSLLLVSFVLCCVLWSKSSNDAFYYLHTRMWQLMLGALLALVYTQIEPRIHGALKDALALIALCLLVLIYIYGDDASHHIVVNSGAASTSALLFILAVGRGSRSARIFSFGPLVYLGKISYSLYLWHWPLLVYGKLLLPGDSQWLALVASVALAMASYHLIEQPFLRGFRHRRSLLISLPFVAAATLVSAKYHPFSLAGPAAIIELLNEPMALDKGKKFEARDLVLEKGKLGYEVRHSTDICDIVLVGSSHARMHAPAVHDYVERRRLNAVYMAFSAIGVTTRKAVRGTDLESVELLQSACRKNIETLNPRVVIVFGRWDAEIRRGFDETFKSQIQHFGSHADQVLVVSQVPHIIVPEGFGNSLQQYLLQEFSEGSLPDLQVKSRVVESNHRVEKLVKDLALPNVAYVDVYDVLFREGQGPRFLENRHILYADDDHLNPYGAKYVFRNRVEEVLEALLVKSRKIR